MFLDVAEEILPVGLGNCRDHRGEARTNCLIISDHTSLSEQKALCSMSLAA